MKSVVLFISLLIMTLGIAKTYHSPPRDFEAYHLAATRFIHGENPYVATDAYPYKYALTTLLLIAPFGLFPMSVAFPLFCALMILAALAAPWLALSILKPEPKSLGIALILGFVGSLRFIDNEFHSRQINLIALCLILIGIRLYLRQRRSGILIWMVGSLFKFHPGLSLGAIVSKKSLPWIFAFGLLCFLVPRPDLWFQLPSHFASTTPLFDASQATIFQSFRQLAMNLGLPAILGIGLFVVAFIATYFFVPAQERPTSVLLSASSLMLVALMGSPLAWQHTYSVLWVFIPLAYLCGIVAEQRVVIACSLFLGLSSRGVIGEWAVPLERFQSVLWVSLILMVILLREARRYSKA